jgi:pyruvate/2-oxoglutarate dehydrogenase complex dihydrolipoamide acyltransferase (E2) component
MAVEVTVPALGENIEEAMLTGWSKRVGDYVEQGETLFQVESEKATVDAEAVTVGQVIGFLGEKGEEV